MASKQLASVVVKVKHEVADSSMDDESDCVAKIEIIPNEPYATLPSGELFYGACTPWVENFQSILKVSIFFYNFQFFMLLF
jgi:hypothetical protein